MRRSLLPLLLCAFGALACACATSSSTLKPATQESKSMHPASIHAFLALGDSYTIGESVRESERWPMQLAAALRTRGIAIDAPRIVAQTGWTTDELSDAMDDSTFAPPYALVTLMIGVNNQYRGRDVHEYREQFDALLVRAIQLAGNDATRVIVLSIPDWGATPFGHASGRELAHVSAQIGSFNAAAEEATKARGAAWVDVTPVSREVTNHPELAAHDGLHPSAAMYALWVDLVLPVAENRLRKDAKPAH
jgi:lysophospholipase L1-like esterase